MCSVKPPCVIICLALLCSIHLRDGGAGIGDQSLYLVYGGSQVGSMSRSQSQLDALPASFKMAWDFVFLALPLMTPTCSILINHGILYSQPLFGTLKFSSLFACVCQVLVLGVHQFVWCICSFLRGLTKLID